tara:strand:+ start:88996 stop:89934 length:939 start_codon:yes stop_codon:yes gene_type:complete
MGEHVRFETITSDEAGQRVDNYLMAQFRQVPKSRIYRAVRKGEVRIDKKRVKAEYKLQAGDKIRIPPLRVPEKTETSKAGDGLTKLLLKRILYEDDGMFIINKPSGLAVHAGSGVEIGLIEALRQMYPKLKHMDLAHRLDRETSGCIIVAKKRSVLRELHRMLREHEMEKSYQCLCKGRWRGEKQVVKLALEKNHLQSGERVVRVDREGKPSQTTFYVLQHFADATLMRADLQTGRTHQIRVHAAAVKHPVVGDSKYGHREFDKTMRQFGVKRLFLHAWRLAFIAPTTGQRLEVIAELDDDLQQSINRLPNE